MSKNAKRTLNLSVQWDLQKHFPEFYDSSGNIKKKKLDRYINDIQKSIQKLVDKWGDKKITNSKQAVLFVKDLNKYLYQYDGGGRLIANLLLMKWTNLDNDDIEHLNVKYGSKLYEIDILVEKLILKLVRLPVKLQKEILEYTKTHFVTLEDRKYSLFHYFLIIFHEKKHVLHNETEALLTRLAKPLFINWSNLTSTKVSSSTIKFMGKTMAVAEIGKYMRGDFSKAYLIDKADRKIQQISKENLYIATRELNSLYYSMHVVNKTRKYKNLLQEVLFRRQIKEDTVRTMVNVVSQNFDVPQKYYSLLNSQYVEYVQRVRENIDSKIKTNNDKKDFPKLHYGLKLMLPKQDLHKDGYKSSSIGNNNGAIKEASEEANNTMSYEKAVNVLQEILGGLDKEALTYFEDMKNGRIDVYSKKGKRSGAFSVSFNKATPGFILLNWKDQQASLYTLAHEFGHAYHSYLAFKYQPAIYAGYSLAIAEFASTFLESIVSFEYNAGNVGKNVGTDLIIGKKETGGQYIDKYSAYRTVLEDISAIFRQIALFNFEIEVHDIFENERFLSTKQIGNLFAKHMKAYLGPDVRFLKRHYNAWVLWPHIRRPFYVFTYASGLLTAYSLLADYFKADTFSKKKEIFNKYKQILQAGESDYVENIFASAGLDITKQSFWQKGLDVVNMHLEKIKV